MVSMKDIAKRCGVSVATVSKALNGKRDIGEETRKFNCQTADEMGYLTNAAARTLKTNRTYNLGVLFVDEINSGLTHRYFASVLDNFKDEAEKHGYDITFINRNIGAKPVTYLQHCIYRGLDGVVIACVDFTDPQVVELVESNIPVITIDRLFTHKTAVMSDNVAGMETLVQYAYEMGHRKLAIIKGEAHSSVTAYRVASFYKTCEKLGIEVPDEYARQSRYTDTERCEREMEALINLPIRPTCVFCPDDFSAIGAMNAAHKAGLKIPEDISIIGYDGIQLSQVMTPKMTTYHQDTNKLGRLAAERLIEAIEHPKTNVPEVLLVPGNLITGESVNRL